MDFAKTYAEMYDNELLNLATEPDSLTESARTALFGELSKRGLGEKEIRAWQRSSVDAAPAPEKETKEMAEELGGHAGSWSMFGQAHLKHLEEPETEESSGSEDKETAREKLEEPSVDQDKLAEAEPLLQRSLAIWQKVFGPEHPNVAQSLSLLAVLYNAQGKNEEAERLFQQALAIWEAVWEKNPEASHGFAAMSGMSFNHAMLFMFYERWLPIREKALGSEHPGVAQILENYAALLRKMRHEDEAEEMELRAKAIRAMNAP
ncbi:MAG: tetratricopeptide repeat protein [Acidobacteria bacterium]|nr:tetratricopeptide repeat protein [Acidobacteriota bacterium]